MARAQQHRARHGLLHGGSHYGYCDDGSLHPVESLIVRRLVNDYLIGLSFNVIARALTADRIPGPRTDRWRATTVRAMLDSERLHQRRWDHAGTRQVTGSWERLLAPDESALVQASLLVPRRDAARSSGSLLGGILRCRRCGQRMVAGTARHDKRIYVCKTATGRCHSTRLPADDLDADTEATALARFASAAHPNRRWASLSFRRAVVCALLPFDQTAMSSDAPRRGEADYAST